MQSYMLTLTYLALYHHFGMVLQKDKNCGLDLYLFYFFLYLARYLIFFLYLFTYCCLRCRFCFYYMLSKSLLFWFFDPIVCIYLILMYCFNCHNSMSFCIFKLSLYIFIVVIIVGLTTVISFVKLNIQLICVNCKI